MRQFRKIRTGDINLDQLQTNVEQVFGEIQKKPIIDGTLLSGVVVGTTETEVNHELNRQPLGFIVVDRNSAGVVYKTRATSKLLVLQASAPVTVSLWVF